MNTPNNSFANGQQSQGVPNGSANPFNPSFQPLTIVCQIPGNYAFDIKMSTPSSTSVCISPNTVGNRQTVANHDLQPGYSGVIRGEPPLPYFNPTRPQLHPNNGPSPIMLRNLNRIMVSITSGPVMETTSPNFVPSEGYGPSGFRPLHDQSIPSMSPSSRCSSMSSLSWNSSRDSSSMSDSSYHFDHNCCYCGDTNHEQCPNCGNFSHHF